ncbi:MAG TPA: hypothetical protein VGM20_08910 [Gemmatimonadales bacterium]|jgi:hypothetical protein
MERLLKLAFIFDYMADHQLNAPSREDLRGLGHDLVTLIDALAAKDHLDISATLAPLQTASRERKILEFLSQYAKTTRYYNLDALTLQQNVTDPLSVWNRLLSSIVDDEMEPGKIALIQERAAEFAGVAGTFMGGIVHGLDQQQLSLEELVRLPQLQRWAAPRAIWSIYRILNPMKTAMLKAFERVSIVDHQIAASTGKSSVPEMTEFLIWLWGERRDVLAKQRWP